MTREELSLATAEIRRRISHRENAPAEECLMCQAFANAPKKLTMRDLRLAAALGATLAHEFAQLGVPLPVMICHACWESTAALQGAARGSEGQAIQ